MLRERLASAGPWLLGGVTSLLAGAYLAGRASSTTQPEVAAPATDAAEPDDDSLLEANNRIRDAGKWLIASSAAVGAILLAGSQLSSIGKLPVGAPTSVDGARLWLAVVGVVAALVGVVYLIWRAVQLLLPVTVTLTELDRAWNVGESGELGPVVAFFKSNTAYLQGLADPNDLMTRRNEAVSKLGAAKDPATTAAARAEVTDLDAREAAIQTIAQHELLVSRFHRLLGRLLRSASVVALGVVLFAWAANPPTPAEPSADLQGANLVGASLRDADLRDANLDGADLTRADLSGADLTGASIQNVTWSDTICPDGENSETVGNTCAGHLSG